MGVWLALNTSDEGSARPILHFVEWVLSINALTKPYFLIVYDLVDLNLSMLGLLMSQN